MSTRSIIVIHGENNYKQKQTIRLYKHSDGYPTGNLPLIAEAIKKAKSQVDEANTEEKRRNEEFLEKHPEYKNDPNPFHREHKIIPGQLAGLIVGESSDVYGMGAYVEDQSNEFTPEALGEQWDLEWIYVVDLDKKVVSVYGGGYTGKAPQDTYNKGTVSPELEIGNFKDEFRESRRKKLCKAIRAFSGTGFCIAEAGIKPKRAKIPKTKGHGRVDMLVSQNGIQTGVKV